MFLYIFVLETHIGEAPIIFIPQIFTTNILTTHTAHTSSAVYVWYCQYGIMSRPLYRFTSCAATVTSYAVCFNPADYLYLVE